MCKHFLTLTGFVYVNNIVNVLIVVYVEVIVVLIQYDQVCAVSMEQGTWA